jgi:hypothetical protein
MNISDLSTAQLQRIIAIKQQIEDLQSQLDSVADGGAAPIKRGPGRPKGKRKMSAAGRAAIAAGARLRWAKIKGNGASSEPVKVKRTLSPAHKRKLIKALAKARKVRLANLKGNQVTPEPAKKDRRSSPATRAKLAAAAKARWARVKAEGKKTL